MRDFDADKMDIILKKLEKTAKHPGMEVFHRLMTILSEISYEDGELLEKGQKLFNQMVNEVEREDSEAIKPIIVVENFINELRSSM